MPFPKKAKPAEPAEADEPKFTPRPPDYHLCLKDKTTGESNRVGAAWRNEGGSLSIRLHLGTTLTHDRNLLLTLFENTPYPYARDRSDLST